MKEELKELESIFYGRGETKGFKYDKISESVNGFFYSVEIEGVVDHFIVFKRKIGNAHPKAEDQRMRIRFPNSNDYGVWAWCILDFDDAWAKFEKL